jgi:hypothetical protein
MTGLPEVLTSSSECRVLDAVAFVRRNSPGQRVTVWIDPVQPYDAALITGVPNFLWVRMWSTLVVGSALVLLILSILFGNAPRTVGDYAFLFLGA